MCSYPDRTIFNLYTQYRYGTDRMHLDYEALALALLAMRAWLEENDPEQNEIVGFPRIGCGLAGGDWEVVQEFIESAFPDRTVHVYTL